MAASSLARVAAWVCHAQAMTDSSLSREKKFRQRSRFPFHSSVRAAARRNDRQMIRRITVRRGRSSQTTVSARAQNQVLDLAGVVPVDHPALARHHVRDVPPELLPGQRYPAGLMEDGIQLEEFGVQRARERPGQGGFARTGGAHHRDPLHSTPYRGRT